MKVPTRAVSPLVARLAAVTAAHGLAASAPLAESSRFAAAGNNFRDNKDKLAVLRAQQATADTLAQAAGMRVVLSELRSIHLLHEQEQHITMLAELQQVEIDLAAALEDEKAQRKLLTSKGTLEAQRDSLLSLLSSL